MAKLTPNEIQDINRQIAAGTYQYVPDVEQEEKPKRGRPSKAKPEDVEPTEVAGDE